MQTIPHPVWTVFAYEWLNGGFEKLQEIAADPKAAQEFAFVFGKWEKGNPYPFIVDFLKGFAVPNAAGVFTFVAVARRWSELHSCLDSWSGRARSEG